MIKTHFLSKSQYMRGLQCLKSLWLYNHRRDLIPETPPGLQMIFDQGSAVGELARRKFAGGMLIEADHFHREQAVSETENAIKDGRKILYEAGFVYDGVLVRPDIIIKNKNGTWNLIEVKSSTEVKDVHLPDAAIQKYVLEGAGLKIGKVFLMHINNKYVRHGEINPDEFFKIEDITEEIMEAFEDVQNNLKTFKKTVTEQNEPAVEIGQQCYGPYECDFCDYCWKHIPDYSVYNLSHLKWEKKELLRSMGITEIKNIPDNFKLSKSQALKVAVEKNGKPHIEPQRINKLLKELRYPLYFLDFETINPAIPLFDGLKPFQCLVFQASLHIQDKPGCKIRHLEYLGDGIINPHPGMVKFLIEHIGNKGSVIVYSASFEGTRLKELADMYPEHSHVLLNIKERIWDMAAPFQKGYFIHPDFRCSYSVKNILPVLVPGMTYEGMEIADGDDAQVAYLNLMSGNLKAKEAERIKKDLKKYCSQDTMAMVRILDKLEQSA